MICVTFYSLLISQIEFDSLSQSEEARHIILLASGWGEPRNAQGPSLQTIPLQLFDHKHLVYSLSLTRENTKALPSHNVKSMPGDFG
jgi:hypothetical protein